MRERQLQPYNIRQGVDEKIARKVTTTTWGSTPTNVAVTAFKITTTPWVDVSSTVLIGLPSVLGDEITTPLIGNLTSGDVYRIEINFTTSSGNVFEPFFIVTAED